MHLGLGRGHDDDNREGRTRRARQDYSVNEAAPAQWLMQKQVVRRGDGPLSSHVPHTRRQAAGIDLVKGSGTRPKAIITVFWPFLMLIFRGHSFDSEHLVRLVVAGDSGYA